MDFLKDRNIIVKNESLYLTALTHSSYANEHNCESYERLEFLGDAVLDLIIGEYFYLHFKDSEGDMSKERASYVCEDALFEYSKEIGLIDSIRVGNGIQEITKAIGADCFESILACIFLEHGYSTAKRYAIDIIAPYIEKGILFSHDYKSVLQELINMGTSTISYEIVNEEGPQNDKTFTVDVLIDGLTLGRGIGKTKKEAEQIAARNAISKKASEVDETTKY